MQPSSYQLQMRIELSPFDAAIRGITRTAAGWLGILAQWNAKLAQRLAEARQRQRAIRTFHQFDDRALADIGVTRGEIELAVRGQNPRHCR
jgi:uncharacterized protein YjiS (DUF1127 family)